MHRETLARLRHDHAWASSHPEGEARTRRVLWLTLVTMAAEIAAGTLTGSLALLADGWHMGTHAAAMALAWLAYMVARRHARNPRFTFGTGKVTLLGAYTSAVILLIVALLMAVEAAHRFLRPLTIRFDEAIVVAVVGLAVNIVSARLLISGGGHRHTHEPGHEHEHGPVHDHNLRAAYLHVLADALTSVLAIAALTAGRFLGWVWLDPAMGVVGGLVIARWSWGLLRDTTGSLLDADVPPAELAEIRAALEADADNRVADLHVWRIGSREKAAAASIVTHVPQPPAHYRELLAGFPDLRHVTVEVQACDGCEDAGSSPRV